MEYTNVASVLVYSSRLWCY